MTPLSGDALPPVVWFDASSSSSSSHRVFPVSTTLSRMAGNRGSILAHTLLSFFRVGVMMVLPRLQYFGGLDDRLLDDHRPP